MDVSGGDTTRTSKSTSSSADASSVPSGNGVKGGGRTGSSIPTRDLKSAVSNKPNKNNNANGTKKFNR